MIREMRLLLDTDTGRVDVLAASRDNTVNLYMLRAARRMLLDCPPPPVPPEVLTTKPAPAGK